MPDDGASLTRLYVFGASCTLFATAYGFLHLQPMPEMALVLNFGPPVAVASWLAMDAKRHQVGAVSDAGFLFYVGFPVAMPWYALRTRGRAGWWLVGQLYGIAVCGRLAFGWGRFLRLLTMRLL